MTASGLVGGQAGQPAQMVPKSVLFKDPINLKPLSDNPCEATSLSL